MVNTYNDYDSAGDVMASRMRLRGRILLLGNSMMMTLFLSVGILLVLCIGWVVPIYEMFLRSSLVSTMREYLPLADVSLSLFLIFLYMAVAVHVRMGADRYFLRLSQKKGGSPRDIFYYLHPKRFFSALFFSIRISVLKVFFAASSYSPAVVCLWIVFALSEKGVSLFVALSLFLGGVAFLFSGFIFFRRISTLLFLAEYIFISGEYISFRQIITLSVSGMKGKERLLLRLKRSFIGWFLLCVFILPIGYVWSYYRQTMAVAAAKFLEG